MDPGQLLGAALGWLRPRHQRRSQRPKSQPASSQRSGSVTVFQRSAERSRLHVRGGYDVAAHLLHALVGHDAPSRPMAPCSTETYDRLLAGETVSWLRILHEHRMLGSFTVPHLIAAGAVQMMPLGEDETHVIDVRLRLWNRPSEQRDRSPLVRLVQERVALPVADRTKSRQEDPRPSRHR